MWSMVKPLKRVCLPAVGAVTTESMGVTPPVSSNLQLSPVMVRKPVQLDHMQEQGVIQGYTYIIYCNMQGFI